MHLRSLPSPHLASFLQRRARDQVAHRTFFVLASLPPVLVVAILAALIVRSWPILKAIPLWELLTDRVWLPNQGRFGFYPFLAGTFWVTVVSVILAVPPCLLSAIFLSEYASRSLRNGMKPIMDLLAAIPSVVYGVWGMVAIVPAVQALSEGTRRLVGDVPLLNTQNPTGYSVLAGGIVLAVMIAPFILTVTYEVFSSIPRACREASLAVGATRWQTIKYTLLPQARAGIFASVVLGASRALGETMAVLMVVGNVPQVPRSIFDAAYPLPALIANNYGEMLSIPLYDAALMTAALLLFLVVLFFNLLATLVLRHALRRPSL